jgi:pyochelin biosynthetic protein PchC
MTVLHGLTGPVAPTFHLVCFPHAGGRADFYHPWHEYLPMGVAMSTVEYPGRGQRGGEPVAASIEELAEEAAAALAGRAEVPLVLFGHSMGALVAFEVAMRLSRPAAALVISSIPAPHLLHSRPPLPSRENEVWEHAHHLGGTPDPVYRNRLLRRLTLPALCADYALVNRYHYRSETLISCPIVACHAIDDPITETGQISAWRELTTSKFELKSFTGGHFYLSASWQTFASSLLSTFWPSIVPSPRGLSNERLCPEFGDRCGGLGVGS